MSTNKMADIDYKSLFRIRTVTCFVNLSKEDFVAESPRLLDTKVADAVHCIRKAEQALIREAYQIQTVRLATNSFGEWISKDVDRDLQRLDAVLAKHQIDFCSLGPATSIRQVDEICRKIVAASPRFSCSASLLATDVAMAQASARCIRDIAHSDAPDFLKDGLGNFRFCVASSDAYVPFFPVAKSDSNRHDGTLRFALGLENGALAQRLLSDCQSIQNIRKFETGMTQALKPLQAICQQSAKETNAMYIGMDTSLNPSLDDGGSVARAIEALVEVEQFGGPGTLAAAAAITKSIQSLPGILRTGYCGLMLPLCEDQRLAELASSGSLHIADLLSISSVCGVGVDTVPLAGDCSEKELTCLLLDVAGIADRWGKSLSCRVFPAPGKQMGDWTTFDSPYMTNARALPLSRYP